MEQLDISRTNNSILKRDNSISCIRLLSMVLIIVCHFMQYLNIELAWWFNVGVQIFFVMSGFLYGKRKIIDPFSFWYKQLRKVLIPYWTIIIIVSIIHKIITPNIFSWGKMISAMLCVGRIAGMEHLWFVQYILICYLLLPYLLNLKDIMKKYSYKIQIVITLALLIMVQFVGFTFKEYDLIPNRITCFICGVILGSINIMAIKRLSVGIYLITIIMNVVKIYGVYVLKIENNLIFNLFLGYAHGILGIAIFIFLYLVFFNGKDYRILKYSDRYSYYIYLVHQIFILGPLTLMKLTPSTTVNVVFICFSILIAAFFLEKIDKSVNKLINLYIQRFDC